MYHAIYDLVLYSSHYPLSFAFLTLTLIDQGVKMAALDPDSYMTLRNAEGKLRVYMDLAKTSRLAKSDKERHYRCMLHRGLVYIVVDC